MGDSIKPRLTAIEMLEQRLYVTTDGKPHDVHDSVSNVIDYAIAFAKQEIKLALEDIYEKAKHGDEDHQKWLKEFFDNYSLENVK